jgi:hypothetical protein
MKLILYKVPLPLTCAEYQVAQLWSVAEASKNETGGGSGIEVLANEPFSKTQPDGSTISGFYTHKIYHLRDKVPRWVRIMADSIIGKESMEFHEKAWNSFPYCKTVFSHPKFAKFEVVIESMHHDDRGNNPSPNYLCTSEFLSLDGKPVSFADVPEVFINIAEPLDGSEESDPTKTRSEKAGRGPIPPLGNWWEKFPDPMMTCYKLVRMNFKYYGLQTKVENYFVEEERKLFLRFHKNVYCWMDKWHGLSMEDIRALESKTQAELKEKLKDGEVQGYKAVD